MLSVAPKVPPVGPARIQFLMLLLKKLQDTALTEREEAFSFGHKALLFQEKALYLRETVLYLKKSNAKEIERIDGEINIIYENKNNFTKNKSVALKKYGELVSPLLARKEYLNRQYNSLKEEEKIANKEYEIADEKSRIAYKEYEIATKEAEQLSIKLASLVNKSKSSTLEPITLEPSTLEPSTLEPITLEPSIPEQQPSLSTEPHPNGGKRKSSKNKKRTNKKKGKGKKSSKKRH